MIDTFIPLVERRASWVVFQFGKSLLPFSLWHIRIMASVIYFTTFSDEKFKSSLIVSVPDVFISMQTS